MTFHQQGGGGDEGAGETLLAAMAWRLGFSTFHSLCVRILRREWEAASLPRGFVIYDEDVRPGPQFATSCAGFDLSEKLHPPRRILARISGAKNSGRARR